MVPRRQTTTIIALYVGEAYTFVSTYEWKLVFRRSQIIEPETDPSLYIRVWDREVVVYLKK